MIAFQRLSMIVGSFVCFSLGIGAQTSVLTISAPQSGTSFGTAVEAVGDTDGDGVEDFAISATSGGPAGSGYVRVYSGVDASLRLTITSPNQGNQPGEAFGVRVRKGGDLNGDGFDDLVIGLRPGGNTSGQLWPGRVEAFSGLNGALIRSIGLASSCYGLRPFIGERFEPLGDVDGDGVCDFVLGKQGGIAPGCPIFGGCQVSCQGEMRVVSGATGSSSPPLLFQQGGADLYFPAVLANVGDANGDGRDDFITASLGHPNRPDNCSSFCFPIAMQPLRILTYSSSNFSLLNQISGSPAGGISLSAVGDLTGDGISEILLGGSFTTLLSAVGTTPIATALISFTAATGIGDQNGDGVPDILVGRSNGVDVRSGADFTSLRWIPGGSTFGKAVCNLGDINLDGIDDFAVGAPALDRVEIFLGGGVTPAPASAVPAGGGSGDGALPPPVLAVSPPVLGSNLTFSVGQAVPSSFGTLIASPGPAVMPFPGSPWVVDWNTPVFAIAPITTTPSGDWSHVVPLPTFFAAAGAQFTVQAVVWAPTIGTASNGFELTLGY